MFAFNGQHPGPLLRVAQGTTLAVVFTNATDFPTTVHWHGLRLENRFDGTSLTQEPVPPGRKLRVPGLLPRRRPLLVPPPTSART